ncbi:hypothetical protein CEXT_181941 [Caerostris extrusa]|uniref:Uncharacterized protein n=1 Tax=Caerostris extrusa TaxID=172846 RepID=A0AAV4QMQ1_CAEEX|nr:hypothetical protein CEXT_181941 [Caerostris extrusa]
MKEGETMEGYIYRIQSSSPPLLPLRGSNIPKGQHFLGKVEGDGGRGGVFETSSSFGRVDPNRMWNPDLEWWAQKNTQRERKK